MHLKQRSPSIDLDRTGNLKIEKVPLMQDNNYINAISYF